MMKVFSYLFKDPKVIYDEGVFLFKGSYSLSVLDEDETKQKSVKHYRIRDLDSGGCYITTKHKCSSLEELINHYTSN